VPREFSHKILGLSGGLFSGDSRDSRGGSGERIFSTIWRARQAFLRLPRADQLLPPPIAHLFLRLKVSIPGIVGVTIEMIVIPGELVSISSEKNLTGHESTLRIFYNRIEDISGS
jgi:hypothetical protein